jgi:hypothetical protein
MASHQGGCLCNDIRYEVTAEPIRVTYCHCRYCQRATGSAYAVEPIFRKSDFRLTAGQPTEYSSASAGSGQRVTANFCAACGTKLFLDLERFPDVVAIYGGTFDDPNWFARSPDIARHIFTDFAQTGTLIPAGFATYHRHALNNDGTPAEPTVFEKPKLIDDAD